MICDKHLNDTPVISTAFDGKLRNLYRRNCAKCNKIFLTPKHTKQKYCSRICSSFIRSTRVLLTCDQCKKSIQRKKSTIKFSRHKKFFCSRACKDFAQSLKGNCPDIRPKNWGLGQTRYRNLILISQCEGCDEKRKFLLFVHHKDGNRKNSDLKNLEVVCPSCHVIRHLKLLSNGEWIHHTKSLTPRELLPQFSITNFGGPREIRTPDSTLQK